MDFLDPQKKRKHTIRLYIGYALIAILIAFGTVVLLFATSGYGIDDSGNVIQNGLVFASSRPNGAAVTIENTRFKDRQQATTNTRLVLQEGDYQIKIEKDGYRSWQKDFSLLGGSIERFVYPILFPNELTLSERGRYSAQPTFVTSSPDRQWIVVQRPDNFATFDVYNANNPDDAIQTLALPAGLLAATTAPHTLELVEWSTDNVNIVALHTYDNGKKEFIVINREDANKSQNINKVTGLSPHDVLLKDKKIDEFYLHMAPNGLLQTYDVDAKLATPIADKVAEFQPHGDDMVAYIVPHAQKANVMEVKLLTDKNSYSLRELPLSPEGFVLDLARFDNSWYVVAGATSDNRVYVYEDPLAFLKEENPTKPLLLRTMRLEHPQKVSFSANARIIVAQSGQNFVAYDAETDRQHKYTISQSFDSGKPAVWMDGHRLVSSSDKSVVVFDFDGINVQKLTPTISTLPAMFDRDYDNMYSIAPSDQAGSFALTRGALLTEQDR